MKKVLLIGGLGLAGFGFYRYFKYQVNQAVNYGYVIKQLGHEVNAVNEEIKRLQDIKKRNEKAIERMETAISNAMQLYGIEKVDSSFLKLSFRKSESVEIVNEAQLAPEYLTTKTTTAPNKTAIKEAIKQGVEVIVLVVSWNAEGEASFVTCDMPVN